MLSAIVLSAHNHKSACSARQRSVWCRHVWAARWQLLAHCVQVCSARPCYISRQEWRVPCALQFYLLTHMRYFSSFATHKTSAVIWCVSSRYTFLMVLLRWVQFQCACWCDINHETLTVCWPFALDVRVLTVKKHKAEHKHPMGECVQFSTSCENRERFFGPISRCRHPPAARGKTKKLVKRHAAELPRAEDVCGLLCCYHSYVTWFLSGRFIPVRSSNF